MESFECVLLHHLKIWTIDLQKECHSLEAHGKLCLTYLIVLDWSQDLVYKFTSFILIVVLMLIN